MKNTTQYNNSFSSPASYSLMVFRELPLTKSEWLVAENLQFFNKEENGTIYSLKETFKDQAHLLGFIDKLNENHFTIISINKIQ